MNLRGSIDPAAANLLEGQSPRNQAYVGLTLRLPRRFDVAGDVYVTGAVPTFAVPAYTRLDLNASWQARQPLRLKLAAQNLLGTHLEHGDLPAPANLVKRAVHLEAVLAF